MTIPDPRMAEQDSDTHAHRNDITAAMVAMDPLWTASPRGNPFFAELAHVYGTPSAVTLWELAADWHRCELAWELRARTLPSAAA